MKVELNINTNIVCAYQLFCILDFSPPLICKFNKKIDFIVDKFFIYS